MEKSVSIVCGLVYGFLGFVIHTTNNEGVCIKTTNNRVAQKNRRKAVATKPVAAVKPGKTPPPHAIRLKFPPHFPSSASALPPAGWRRWNNF